LDKSCANIWGFGDTPGRSLPNYGQVGTNPEVSAYQGVVSACSEANLHAFGGGADFGVIILRVGDYFVDNGVGVVGIMMVEN